MYIGASLNLQNGLSVGSLNASSTWAQVMGVSGSTCKMSTNETITAAGHINGKAGSLTGTNGKLVAPTAAGVYIGLDTSTGGGIEICTGAVR